MLERPDAGGLWAQLERTRRGLRAWGIRAAAWSALGLLAALTLTSALWVLWGASDAAVALLQVSVLGLTLLAAGVLAWVLRGQGSDLSRVALRMDAALPPREVTSFRSALELSRDPAGERTSPELVARAVGEATARAEQAAARVLESARRDANRAMVASLALLTALMLTTLATPRSVWQGLSAWSAMGTLQDAWKRLPPEPRLGDIHISYRYPDYVGRAPRALRSASGAVRALPGTEVTIRTTASEAVTEATLLLEAVDEEDGTPVAMTVDGPEVAASFVLRRPGSYRIRLNTPSGPMEERRGHAIELEPDEIPQVVLLQPDASPLEVNAQDPLDLVFRASDDFGLSEARLHYRILGSARPDAEGSVKLTASPSGKTRYTGRTTFELAQLKLQPGDRVSYFVEVTDNDSVHGPKVGASRTQELRIYSEQDHHDRVLAAQQKALDELVHLLGDHLEQGFELTNFRRSLAQSRQMLERTSLAADLLQQAEEASREDPLGRPQVADAFRQARGRLVKERVRSDRAVQSAGRAFEQSPTEAEAEGRRVVRAQDRMVGNLEQDVVYLADLLNDQRMIDAETLLRELREEQRALREAMQAYRDEPTEEGRQEIAAQIDRIQRRIQDLLKKLGSLQQGIPSEYVNQDALDPGLDQPLQQMQQLMEKGDLDGAMERVDRMLEQTERMLSQLQQGRNELQSREYSEIQQRAEEIWQELEDVTMRQRELARRTEEAARVAQERMSQRVEQADAFIEEQKRRLEQARAELDRVAPEPPLPDAESFEGVKERVMDAERALEARDFGAAQDVLERGRRRLDQLERDTDRRVEQAKRFEDLFEGLGPLKAQQQAVQRANEEVQAVQKALERLMPSPESVLEPEERQRLQAMQGEQSQLQDRTEQLQAQLDELAEQLPIVGEAVGDSLQQAQSAMQEASERLGGGDAPAGLRRERQALEALEQLREQMQQMGQGGGGGGVPLPFGSMPQGQPSEGSSGRSESQDRVEIPQPEQYEAPSEFREDILEAAKQGTVDSFKEAVRRYYEELVK